jgi:hypothetical protein
MLDDYIGATVYTAALVDLIVLHSNTGIRSVDQSLIKTIVRT